MRYGSIMRLVSFAVTIVVFMFWSSAIGCGQTIESRLNQPVEVFNSESRTTEEQLLDFARAFKLPVGLELMAGDEGLAAPIHAKDGSALNVLKMIIEQRPGYDFDIADGVINVYSTKLVGDAKNFLNLRLPKFQIENQNLIGGTAIRTAHSIIEAYHL